MRALIFVALLASVAAAEPRKDMGTWDCKGSKTVAVTIAPGSQTLVWTGRCSGEEGHSVVIEPAKKTKLETKESQVGDEIRLDVKNPTEAPITIKVHVFVGFA